MSIKLPGGVHTREPAVDHRLKRILQVCSDTVGKPLSQCRVLDLACLEGHYALEFAARGSEVVGIEGRAASVAKCNFARDALGFDRAAFHQDDVRNLSVEKYGVFDIVICSGLLYHLPAPDAWALIRAMHDLCTGLVVVDTFIALSDRVRVELDGTAYYGHVYGEHGTDESAEGKKFTSAFGNESRYPESRSSPKSAAEHYQNIVEHKKLLRAWKESSARAVFHRDDRRQTPLP